MSVHRCYLVWLRVVSGIPRRGLQVSIKSRAPIQPIPESEAEALAYGEALPTGSQLAETRTLWWRQTALGHRLPAETNIIVMEGG